MHIKSFMINKVSVLFFIDLKKNYNSKKITWISLHLMIFWKIFFRCICQLVIFIFINQMGSRSMIEYNDRYKYLSKY